ncbi:acetate uptake transporter family protein [Actinomadura sp. WMMA1423]|uniref:acetate uptake transporter n=1 Tax=Actinomadura sp. WMMA1423 TaxID=2591108 RepID=UPI0011474700|nr:GPR1/FUN34/YaaH family transporter [Actinomadura sp. WMMA1423]
MTHVEHESTPQAPSAAAEPAPLGLAAFALTTFLFSVKNAGWTDGTDAWLSYALAYGGLVQILAGMWEFRNRNVFWATVFSSYGAFWLGLGLYVVLIAGGAAPAQEANDLGWILLAFAIFNTYITLWATQVNQAVLAVFVAFEATLIILFIGNFATSETTVKIGGYLGVLTAVCAWYASAAGLINGMTGRTFLGVGKPMTALASRSGPR